MAGIRRAIFQNCERKSHSKPSGPIWIREKQGMINFIRTFPFGTHREQKTTSLSLAAGVWQSNVKLRERLRRTFDEEESLFARLHQPSSTSHMRNR
ncbi:hypothetical protein RISK_002786 [Rhodopirellula islandica]|uniref:Uncharacterized protein n=1 Tax=Rhodopirellula islandica TaxID=595434 RepID=A0A0J1EHL5_RHOIS|nr:hypothetical protein RISK_002786 [Rhodopirellula islandica]